MHRYCRIKHPSFFSLFGFLTFFFQYFGKNTFSCKFYGIVILWYNIPRLQYRRRENKMEGKIKNPYLYCRKHRDLTRDEVNERTGISSDRLGDIEKNERDADPEDVVRLAKCYEMPRLCQYYCSHECEVGKMIEYPPVDLQQNENLAEIALEILYCLDDIKKIDERKLIEISRDGKITPDEFSDFEEIKKSLEPISKIYNSLKLWEQEEKSAQLWEEIK